MGGSVRLRPLGSERPRPWARADGPLGEWVGEVRYLGICGWERRLGGSVGEYVRPRHLADHCGGAAGPGGQGPGHLRQQGAGPDRVEVITKESRPLAAGRCENNLLCSIVGIGLGRLRRALGTAALR
jgi:hypothetical protein